MSERQMILEVLNGPLDGARIILQEETEWTRTGGSPLAFPWDMELGEPQARFTVNEQGWWLEGIQSPRGTYRFAQGETETVRAKVHLTEGDTLKASETWLRVDDIGLI
jgi:hypothetical protein